MNKYLKILNILLSIFLIFVLGYYVGLNQNRNEQKLKKLLALIDHEYVEDVDTDSLLDGAINNILGRLDPHSAYLNQEDLQQIQEEMKGEFVGIGIQFRVYQDTIVITRVLDKSPNKKQLKVGDKILKANQISLLANNANQASKLLKGSNETSVQLTIKRNKEILQEEIVRKAIPVNSVTASFMLNQNMGYIKLIRFGEKSAQEVRRALQQLNKQGMQVLIFDLRSNPGGMMTAAESISDEFLKNKELIVYTQGRHQEKQFTYATNYGNFQDKPVFVLVNGSSASASEIVAGAIQEHNRGTIVGRRSFGKGLVQKEIGLGDGSKLRLTTAKYFTPSGRSIQKPYKNGQEQAYANELFKRSSRGELTNQDSMQINKSKPYIAPSGKIVYGGGGIIPDVFVPIDTTSLGYWFYNARGDQKLQNFIFEFAQKNRNNVILHEPKQFHMQFNSLQMLDRFMGKLNVNPHAINTRDKRLLNHYLKAFLARHLFGDNEFYKVWTKQDLAVQKVIQLQSKKE